METARRAYLQVFLQLLAVLDGAALGAFGHKAFRYISFRFLRRYGCVFPLLIEQVFKHVYTSPKPLSSVPVVRGTPSIGKKTGACLWMLIALRLRLAPRCSQIGRLRGPRGRFRE
jgi:hypothetical protein